MVGFGLDYACAHIIILAEISSENLLPIRADFVTERDNRTLRECGIAVYYKRKSYTCVKEYSTCPFLLVLPPAET